MRTCSRSSRRSDQRLRDSHPLVVTCARPFEFFTGTAGGPPAVSAPARTECLVEHFVRSSHLAALVAGGRDARGPSEELEWFSAGSSQD